MSYLKRAAGQKLGHFFQLVVAHVENQQINQNF